MSRYNAITSPIICIRPYYMYLLICTHVCYPVFTSNFSCNIIIYVCIIKCIIPLLVYWGTGTDLDHCLDYLDLGFF